MPILVTSLLEEARLKWSRGKEHLYMLEAESRKFWDSEPYTVIHERNGKEFENVLRFQWTQPVPHNRWGSILGDVVHNMRSALDYIAWRLAGSNLADRYIQFPLCETIDQWKGFQWRLQKSAPIHADALAYIQSLQPYTRPDPQRAFLWILQELDARDKHKLITLTQSLARTAKISGRGQMLIPYEAIENPLENGTIIVEYAGPPEASANLEIDLAFQVVFDNSLGALANCEVGSVLYPIFNAVDVIIANFESRQVY
jgi:hypothetical protein